MSASKLTWMAMEYATGGDLGTDRGHGIPIVISHCPSAIVAYVNRGSWIRWFAPDDGSVLQRLSLEGSVVDVREILRRPTIAAQCFGLGFGARPEVLSTMVRVGCG